MKHVERAAAVLGLVKLVVDIWAAVEDRRKKRKTIEERLAALEART